jgi:hypothetical protein
VLPNMGNFINNTYVVSAIRGFLGSRSHLRIIILKLF